jgi:hypothetical protein
VAAGTTGGIGGAITRGATCGRGANAQEELVAAVAIGAAVADAEEVRAVGANEGVWRAAAAAAAGAAAVVAMTNEDAAAANTRGRVSSSVKTSTGGICERCGALPVVAGRPIAVAAQK